MKAFSTTARAALATAMLLAGSSTMFAQASDTEIQALRDEIHQLEQKVNQLERQQAATVASTGAAAGTVATVTNTGTSAAFPTTAAAPPVVIVNADGQGFGISSADGANSLHLGAEFQADTHWFFGQSSALTRSLSTTPNSTDNDAFLIRRARLILNGTLNTNTNFLLIPEFSGNSPTLYDAYLNQTLTPELQFRAGRFKSPVGLEELQNDAWTYFTERSFVSQIVPNRDIGLEATGDLFNGTLNYSLGLFDGAPDGQNNGKINGLANTGGDDPKDVEARLFEQPFKNDKNSPLKGLGFGLGGTDGDAKPSSGLAGYITEAQETVFAYRAAATGATSYAATVIDGRTSRISPQAYYYAGPFGFETEYAASTVHVLPGVTTSSTASGLSQELTNKAWAFTAGYVLTGEDASYNGVTPKTNFDWSKGTWGAFEVVARYDVLQIDPHAFAADGTTRSAADPAANPNRINDYGVGLNWYLSRNFRASFDFLHEQFDLNGPVTSTTPALLQHNENALMTRFQIVF